MRSKFSKISGVFPPMMSLFYQFMRACVRRCEMCRSEASRAQARQGGRRRGSGMYTPVHEHSEPTSNAVLPSAAASDRYIGEVAFRLQPALAVTRAFLGEQHVHQRIDLVLGIDGELHQPARVGRHGGFA